MRSKVIQILLLLAMTFNITHASIVISEDNCDHASTYEYVIEQSQSSDCGDLCDIHHLFHFTAILDEVLFTFSPLKVQTNFMQKTTLYTPPFQETSIRPPIA